jgi:hypothetical protein
VTAIAVPVTPPSFVAQASDHHAKSNQFIETNITDICILVAPVNVIMITFTPRHNSFGIGRDCLLEGVSDNTVGAGSLEEALTPHRPGRVVSVGPAITRFRSSFERFPPGILVRNF